MPDRLDTVRAMYDGWKDRDREAVERIITDDFVFSAPPDVGLDRAAYFERCWPASKTTERFDFARLIEDGDEVVVTYEATRTDGTRFRNTEVLTFREDRICRVEVYFGWDLE